MLLTAAAFLHLLYQGTLLQRRYTTILVSTYSVGYTITDWGKKSKKKKEKEYMQQMVKRKKILVKLLL